MPIVVADLVALTLPLVAFAAIGIPYGVLCRRLPEGWSRDVAMGILFGVAAMLMMEHPILLAPGVMVDMRHLAIAFAGAFAGPLAMLGSLAIGAAARLAAGGEGALAGVVGMAIAGGAGLLWARLALTRDGLSARGLSLLGAMICVHLLAAFVLPLDLAMGFLRRFSLAMAGLNVFGALVVGGAIGRERLLALTEQALCRSASRDPLTGTLNRRGFEEMATAARTRSAPGEGGMLMVLDLDHFKQVNDTHGHGVGDEVLVQAARRLQGELRSSDVLGRFGGEEFVVFVPSVDREQAGSVARRLQRSIGKRPFRAGERSLAVTVSAGGWWFDEDADLDEAFDVADALLYEAKRQGRDRAVLGPRGEAQGDARRPETPDGPPEAAAVPGAEKVPRTTEAHADRTLH